LSVADLTVIVEKLTKELEVMKAWVSVLEKELAEAKGGMFDLVAFKKKVYFY
jgi:hypothetical protein